MKTDEDKGKYVSGASEIEDSTNNAMAMLGAGYDDQPTVVVEAPNYSKYFKRRKDVVFIRRDFVNELKNISGENLKTLLNRKFSISINRWRKKIIPSNIRWAVWERDNFTCKKCGARQFLSIDHIYPESKGGETSIENCQTLCKSCNSSKGAKENG